MKLMLIVWEMIAKASWGMNMDTTTVELTVEMCLALKLQETGKIYILNLYDSKQNFQHSSVYSTSTS